MVAKAAANRIGHVSVDDIQRHIPIQAIVSKVLCQKKLAVIERFGLDGNVVDQRCGVVAELVSGAEMGEHQVGQAR